MSLFRRVRVLVGALIHAPFLPTPEKIDLDEGQVPERAETPQAKPPSEASPEDLPDQERVVDLIGRQRRDAD